MKSENTLKLIGSAVEQGGLYERIIVVSPGSDDGELKDQDSAQAVLVENGKCVKRQMAIVCDGLTQSPNSAEAARYVSKNVQRLYDEEGICQIARELLDKREAFINTPINLDDIDSPVLRLMFEEIVRDKRACSYQTTFISARLERDELSSPGNLQISIRGCGDSSAFIFTPDGELLYNNLGLSGKNEPITHISPITEALPDSCGEGATGIPVHSEVYLDGVHVLLCSDGFYDSFATFADISAWLFENRAKLEHRLARKEVMAELHARLCRHRGDDDISFVWLFPGIRKIPATDTEALCESASVE